LLILLAVWWGKMSKTLKDFLKEHDACRDGYLFAKDLTLEQFLNSCERGDWILWLFAKSNPDSLKELTLAKGHCANTVRHLMKDKRSIAAVDAAIAFGEGKINRKELYIAYDAAYAATNIAYAAYAATYAADSTNAANIAASAASAAASAAEYAAKYAAEYACKKSNQKLTADICRKYLPIEIWNINKTNE